MIVRGRLDEECCKKKIGVKLLPSSLSTTPTPPSLPLPSSSPSLIKKATKITGKQKGFSDAKTEKLRK